MRKPSASTQSIALEEQRRQETTRSYEESNRRKAQGFDIPSSVDFIPRKDLWSKLEKSLAKHGKTVICPLLGMGGVGKTELAAEYARRAYGGKTPVHYFAVIWLDASDDKNLESKFREHALSIISALLWVDTAGGAKELKEALNDFINPHPEITQASFEKSPLGSINKLLYKLLEHYCSKLKQNWLVVFDDAKPETLKNFLPQEHYLTGHILITSRESEWHSLTGRNGYEKVEVDVFEKEEAWAFLQQRLPKESENERQKLAERLGHLPVALEQAAAVIETDEDIKNIADYLLKFEENKLKYLNASQKQKDNRSYTILAVWETSLQSAKQRAGTEKAEEAFKLCAYFKHLDIPKIIFESFYGKSLSDTLLIALKNTSLIHFNGPKSKTFKIHPLIQEVTRLKIVYPNNEASIVETMQQMKQYSSALQQANDLLNDKPYIEKAIDALNKACGYDKNKPETQEILELLLPHIRQVYAELNQLKSLPLANEYCHASMLLT